MTEQPARESDREQRLNEVLFEYVEAAQAGRAPDRRQLLAEHADLRAELEEFFASHDEVQRLTQPLRDAAREAPPPPPRAEPTPDIGQLGDFRILREVGRGGMGVVYEAEQISLRRRVALKVLPFAAAIDPRQLQRFQNEAMAAAHLRHEHIVPVYAVGSERGVHYYAMQFVDGQSLAALIAELRQITGPRSAEAPSAPPHSGTAPETTGPYPALGAAETRPGDAASAVAASVSRERASGGRRYYDWAADLGRQAAEALEHAHQMGVVHRDIKPANLLLDPRGQLWVTDFGLAQVGNDAGLTMTGEMLGTLRYASPEQALAKPGLVDHRSDIYSLGATLYELLTLRPIFGGRDRHELLRQIANEEPTPPRAADRAIPVELETIVLKATAKEPGDRYATAKDLADDLQRYLEDRPIRARRPTLLEKSTKWARRHRPVVVSALAALVLSVAGLAAATALTARAYDRERQKAAEAEASFRQARRAVDQLAQISEEELAGNPHPQLQGLRRRLLEAALEYYQEFLDQRRDDPSTQAELEASRARVSTLLGELTALMGAIRHDLLFSPHVQKAIELAPDQRGAVVEMDQKWHKSLADVYKLTPAERERRLLALKREQAEELARLLKPDQLRRLKQINLQMRGVLAFLDPDVEEALHLTPDQRRRVREALGQVSFGGPGFGPRGGGPPPGPGGGEGLKPWPPPGRRGGPPDWPDDWRRAQVESRQRAEEKILDLLKPEQRRKWEELIGERFEGEFHFGPPPPPPP